ncbi:MAG: c-type cytochrome [Opitutales bacterium]|nr:c-type cytochrome [Opitutales bacterium]
MYFIPPLLSALALFSLTLNGQNGSVLYQTYCSACHGTQGQGGAAGAVPPLANSLWAQGDPDRMIKIVLHGLMGPIEVVGKEYNLVMPPQGAVLKDGQLADILSHIRTFDNGGEEVTAGRVASVRKKYKDREAYWKADELLKDHPLPVKPGPIKNLVRKYYPLPKSKKSLPSFTELEANASESEATGLISLDGYSQGDHFAVVWEGMLKIKREGQFIFTLDSDDLSALYIDEKKVVEVAGLGGMGRAKTGKVTLHPGLAKIRVEYLEFTGFTGIAASWSGPGTKGVQALSATKVVSKRKPISKMVELKPVGKEAVHYRNFIAGTGNRSFSVGYPGGVNLVFNQENCGLELLWRGRFIDAGPRWNGRGTVRSFPLSGQVYHLQKGSPYPGHTFSFRGMELDDHEYPTFCYSLDGLRVRDRPQPAGRGMERTLTIESGGAGEVVFAPLYQPVPGLSLEGRGLTARQDGTFLLPLHKGDNSFTFHYGIQ